MNWKSALARTTLVLKKHAPTILTWVGVVSIPTSILFATKAARKLDDTLDDVKEKIDAVKEKREIISEEEYSDKEHKADLTKAYLYAGSRLAKLYTPTVLTAGVAIGSVIGSHNLLSKRNVGLFMLYQASKTSYDEYRSKIRELYGDDVDSQVQYGLVKEKVKVKYEDEQGKKKTKTEEINTLGDEGLDYIQKYSPYARFFDEFNPNWERNAEYNLMFLNGVQNWANEKLQARGHMFLNEIYEALGIPHSQAGAVVGWIYDRRNPDHEGDNYIDFHIHNISMERSHAFVNGFEPSILLDFNVDGVIYNLI